MMPLAFQGKQKQAPKEGPVSFVRSQLILFQSRKKFALLYCLATITGLFCIPGTLNELSSPKPDFIIILQMTLPLPLASLLITAGTYIMNDLVDADLDRTNGKKRPIPSGLVSKQQALAFVVLAFGMAMLLTAATFRPISLIIVTLMLAIGITYSMPKIALMKRFVIKTVSIAVFYMLCTFFGMTSVYNLNLAIESPVLVATVLLTLALMVFISSTLNDMGDIEGDKAAGRRTIPIVIGEKNTIKMAIVLAASVLAITLMFFVLTMVADQSSPFSAVTTSIIALTVLLTLDKMQKGMHNAEFMRSQHKKLFPLQMAIHPSLIIGVIVMTI
jgi:geranylgeranylglycerol-phosphate geranylgeranyltransferase